jgi:hypothetical protein
LRTANDQLFSGKVIGFAGEGDGTLASIKLGDQVVFRATNIF